jgi:hypothetical protein
MNNSCDVLEQPFVRTIVDEQDVVSVGRKSVPEVAPSPRDDRANAARPYSLEDSGCHFCTLLDDDAAKAKIDRPFAGFDEFIDVWRRLIRRWFAEKETANVYRESVRRSTRSSMSTYQCAHPNPRASGPRPETSSR